MKITRYILTLAAMLVASSALAADVAPAQLMVYGDGCIQYTMCSAETTAAAGPCNSGTDDIVLRVGQRSTFTAYTEQSTATTYTCFPYSNDHGFASLVASTKMSETPMTPSNRRVHIHGLYDYVWWQCETSIAGGSVTLNMNVCPAGR